MKNHSSKPTTQDNCVLAYIVNKNIVNMPLKCKSNALLFKSPKFRLIGVWNIKDNQVIVFKNGEFYKQGSKIYKTWESAIRETELIFYNSLLKKDKK